jgi:hypothetical protein
LAIYLKAVGEHINFILFILLLNASLNKLTCSTGIPKKLDTNQLAYSKLSSINRIMKTKKYIDKYDI